LQSSSSSRIQVIQKICQQLAAVTFEAAANATCKLYMRGAWTTGFVAFVVRLKDGAV
jgi:hypothetical protein